MKHLTLIIHTDVQQDLTDQLRDMDSISGFTFNHVEGHGLEVENDAFLLARDKVVGHTPRVRVDILLADGYVDEVLDSLRQSVKGIEDQAIYWVTTVEKIGRL